MINQEYQIQNWKIIETKNREKVLTELIELYGYKKGLEKGLDKGKKEGKSEKAREIAKKLLKEGKDEKYILEITGLKKEEYEN